MLFQVRYATCSFNLAHSTPPTHPPPSPFLVPPGRPGQQSFTSCNPDIYQFKTPVQNSYSAKEEYNIFSSYTTLAKQALFLLTSNHRNPSNLNNNISLFRLPSPKKTLSLDISKSSDPTFPLRKVLTIQNTPAPPAPLWLYELSSIAFNCIAPQGHPRADLSAPRTSAFKNKVERFDYCKLSHSALAFRRQHTHIACMTYINA